MADNLLKWLGDLAESDRTPQPERILCAALYIDDEYKYQHQPKNVERGLVICARRHHNAIVLAAAMFPERRDIDRDQGFITSLDRYVQRAEAARIAFAAGQIEAPTDILFSEDLY